MNAHYQSEQIARNQITLFTSIAIGIACLGLLGVISNKAVSKTKEIGIRKVLGAQLHQISQIRLNQLKTDCYRNNYRNTNGLVSDPVLPRKVSERITLEWWHFTIPMVILILLMLISLRQSYGRRQEEILLMRLKCE
jgi:putative ABC transport system permease protein